MKIFSTWAYGETLRMIRPANEESWILDPLSHPDVDVMTERELADLPFNRGYRGTPECVDDRCCG